MRAGAERKSGVEPHHDRVGVLRRLRFVRAHPKPPAEARGSPIGEPYPLPCFVFDRSYARCGANLCAEAACQIIDALCGIMGLIEQRANQSVAPQSDFAGLGLENRLIAAVDEGYRTRADFEQRRLDHL